MRAGPQRGLTRTLMMRRSVRVLRDYRRAASTLADTVSGIAHLHNFALTG
jgi:hypothetical protein